MTGFLAPSLVMAALPAFDLFFVLLCKILFSKRASQFRKNMFYTSDCPRACVHTHGGAEGGQLQVAVIGRY